MTKRRLIYFALYILGGYVLLSNVFANYAVDVRSYRPDGGCGGWGEDRSSCALEGDFRLFWTIAWLAFGLILVTVSRLRARRRLAR